MIAAFLAGATFAAQSLKLQLYKIKNATPECVW
jgi:hypothetical protein